MSKLTRTLVVAATLAAISLVAMTAVAHAQATDEPTGHDARRPPTQGQVGEAWHQHPAGSQQKTAQETAADATLGRVLAPERSTIPNATPARVPAPVPTQSNQRPSWVLASFGVVATTLAGAAARTGRRPSPRPSSPGAGGPRLVRYPDRQFVVAAGAPGPTHPHPRTRGPAPDSRQPTIDSNP